MTALRARQVAAVLDGDGRYDDLTSSEQATVRAVWSATFDALLMSLDLEQTFLESGRSWVELDEAGEVRRRNG